MEPELLDSIAISTIGSFESSVITEAVFIPPASPANVNV